MFWGHSLLSRISAQIESYIPRHQAEKEPLDLKFGRACEGQKTFLLARLILVNFLGIHFFAKLNLYIYKILAN